MRRECGRVAIGEAEQDSVAVGHVDQRLRLWAKFRLGHRHRLWAGERRATEQMAERRHTHFGQMHLAREAFLSQSHHGAGGLPLTASAELAVVDKERIDKVVLGEEAPEQRGAVESTTHERHETLASVGLCDHARACGGGALRLGLRVLLELTSHMNESPSVNRCQCAPACALSRGVRPHGLPLWS